MSAGTLKSFGHDCAHEYVRVHVHACVVTEERELASSTWTGCQLAASGEGAQGFFRLFWKLCCKGGTSKFF